MPARGASAAKHQGAYSWTSILIRWNANDVNSFAATGCWSSVRCVCVPMRTVSRIEPQGRTSVMLGRSDFRETVFSLVSDNWKFSKAGVFLPFCCAALGICKTYQSTERSDQLFYRSMLKTADLIRTSDQKYLVRSMGSVNCTLNGSKIMIFCWLPPFALYT